MVVKEFYSPLRYPGGKSSLYNFLSKTLEHNNINYGIYAEAFAGGAGAALTLLMQEDVGDIYLNDKDLFVYKFWQSVLYHTDELCRLIADSRPTVTEWSRHHDILKNPTRARQLSEVELGFTAFFLNRCNRSGILGSGPIGGHDQTGNWKIDARYNKEELIRRIQKIALYKERIHLSNRDAISFLGWFTKLGHKPENVLMYLDPPYVVQGQELYEHYYTDKQHKQLAIYLQKITRYNWIVSYDDDPLIHGIYRQVIKNVFEFNYYANRTKVGRELVICSKKFLLPNTYEHYSKTKAIEQQVFQAHAV